MATPLIRIILGDVDLLELYDKLHVGLKRRWTSVPAGYRTVRKTGKLKDPAILVIGNERREIDRRVLAAVCYRLRKMGDTTGTLTLNGDSLQLETDTAACRLPCINMKEKA